MSLTSQQPPGVQGWLWRLIENHARGITENQMEKNTDLEMRTAMGSRLLVSVTDI